MIRREKIRKERIKYALLKRK
jgi:hypothetical protein